MGVSPTPSENARIDRIRTQVEYYFGDSNYFTDAYLQRQADEDRYVPIDIIITFRKMTGLQATREDVIKVGLLSITL